MDEEILIKKPTLNKIKIVLSAQLKVLSDPKVLKKVPFYQKLIYNTEIKMLGNLIEEIEETLKDA